MNTQKKEETINTKYHLHEIQHTNGFKIPICYSIYVSIINWMVFFRWISNVGSFLFSSSASPFRLFSAKLCSWLNICMHVCASNHHSIFDDCIQIFCKCCSSEFVGFSPDSLSFLFFFQFECQFLTNAF